MFMKYKWNNGVIFFTQSSRNKRDLFFSRDVIICFFPYTSAHPAVGICGDHNCTRGKPSSSLCPCVKAGYAAEQVASPTCPHAPWQCRSLRSPPRAWGGRLTGDGSRWWAAEEAVV